MEIRNATLNGWWMAIYNNSGTPNRAFDIRVQSCTYGIEFQGTNDIIKGCSTNTTVTGIYCLGAIVMGNAVAGSDFGLAMMGTVCGNTVNGCGLYGIYCRGASTITGNTIITTAAGQRGIYVLTTDLSW